MSVTRTSNYTCDRCAKTQAQPLNDQPARWSRVMMSKPVLANPMEVDGALDLMLCGQCTMEVRDAMTTRNVAVKATS